MEWSTEESRFMRRSPVFLPVGWINVAQGDWLTGEGVFLVDLTGWSAGLQREIFNISRGIGYAIDRYIDRHRHQNN